MPYKENLLQFISNLDPANPQVYYATVAHDAGCGFYKGKKCTCSPEIKVQKVKEK